MTNVNYAAEEQYPMAGADLKGSKIAFVSAQAKAAQNDTLTITNAVAVDWAILTNDATGAIEANTVATNVITLTGSTTSATVSGLIKLRNI